MSKVSLIVAIDEQGGMGINNTLPWHLPADLAHFKKYTLGKPIIMGRKTFESIGRALPGRLNVVLSRGVFTYDGVEVVPSLEAALQLTADAREVMVVGGVRVFHEALNVADTVYLTRVHHIFEADVFFPELDKALWQETLLSQHEADDANAHNLSFYRYIRKKMQKSKNND
ncbi:MAG: dihydrofolate reductase [Legionellaceae bacterium]|nr:dihydrofolate reductase [Legionellaceae bacterium]